jgi:hypothetical protein
MAEGFRERSSVVRLLIISLTTAYAVCLGSFAAGVTIITHGLNGDTDSWIRAMADAIRRYPQYLGTNFTIYRMSVTSQNGLVGPLTVSAQKLAGGNPLESQAGEIIVTLDWRTVANGNSFNTVEIAAAVIPHLLETNFIAELNGRALAELPLHLIGHSRGGSLACEMSRLPGENGVWVDHLTTLDPHPLNNDGFFDVPLYFDVDAPANTYENVLFHDNYFQTLGGLVVGESVAGAYIRKLTTLSGGYSEFFTGSHSDVHLWYHGTIDFNLPTSDSEAWITQSERNAWWTDAEGAGVFAGFYFSSIGAGDRFSTNRPAGAGTSMIADGFNQRWNFGAGSSENRTVLAINTLEWPNIIKLSLTGTNRIVQGQTNSVSAYIQASRVLGSDAKLGVFLDSDFNPWNGNERLLNEVFLSQSPTHQIGLGTLSFTASETNSGPGVHAVFGRITGGGKTRFLYAPELLTVFSSAEPLQLKIVGGGGLQPRVDVIGQPGQRFILENSSDLQAWQSLSTNWLTAEVWSYLDTRPANQTRFYRAMLR